MLTNEQFELLIQSLLKQAEAIDQLRAVVERIAPVNEEVAPNYQIALEHFRNFDWSTISAEVEREDDYGAAIVKWRNQQYIRRAPSNKFGEVIFFSRCVGKTEDGENKYVRLCTFKPTKNRTIEPLPEKVQSVVAATRSSGGAREPWQQWENVGSALDWAARILPGYDKARIEDIMRSVKPDASGKKRVPFYHRVMAIKAQQQAFTINGR